MVHSFVSYTVPVTVTTTSTIPVETLATPAESVVPTVAAGVLESLKQLLGIASAIVPVAEPVAEPSIQETTITTTQTHYVTQPCVATTGETFAIWLNVLYLAPLTYLFVSFFIASYVKRSNAASKISGKSDVNQNVALAEKAGWDAAKGIEKEVYGGENMVNGSEEDPQTPPKKTNGKVKRRG